LLVLEGSIHVADEPSGQALKTGETVLLPAAAGPVMLSPEGSRAVVLDAYLP
jgi:mannose-6-phosphate isomerase class I